MMRARRRTAVAMALALLIGLAGELSAGQVELRYNPTVNYRETGPIRSLRAVPKTSPLSALTGEPKYVSEKPLYFEIKLGPKQTPCAFVLDESAGTGKGYDLLHVDANGNGDLRDDKTMRARLSRRGSYCSGRFPPGEVLVDYGDQKAPWRFAAYCYTYTVRGGQQARTYVSVRSAGRYEGELPLNDRPTKIAVVDADSNGCYNDRLDLRKARTASSGAFYLWGDRVLIDLNGDGRFDMAGPEALVGARYLQLGGEFHELTIAPGGQTIALALARLPLGSLARDGGGAFALTLVSAEHGALTVSSKGEAVKVPAGRYKLYRCSFEVQDMGGNAWKADGSGTMKAEEIVIAQGAVTTAKFGPPLTVGVTARVSPKNDLEAVKPGATLRLSLKLTGQGGEIYSGGSIRKGTARPAPPTVKVIGEDGQVVAAGKFRYG